MATRTQRSGGRMLLSDDKSILQEVLKLWENEYQIEIKSQEGNNKDKMKGEKRTQESQNFRRKNKTLQTSNKMRETSG